MRWCSSEKASTHPSNFRNQKTLHDVLVQYKIPGISGVDTRSITRKIRQHGVLKAGFTDNRDDIDSLINTLVLNYLVMKWKQYLLKTPYVSTGSDLSVVLLDFGKNKILLEN